MSVSITNQPPDENWSQNPVEFTLQGTEFAQDEYKIAVEVYMTGHTPNWELVGDEIFFFTPDGQITFDISYMLDAFFRDIFLESDPIPPPNQVFPIPLLTKRQFKIKVRERYGSPPAYQSYDIDTPAFTVYFGKSPESLDYSTFWSSGISSLSYMLSTQYNKPIFIDKEQPLFFTFRAFVEDYHYLHFNIVYTDGSSQTRTPVTTERIYMRVGDIAIFQGGYTQMDLANVDPTKTVSYWQCQIVTIDLVARSPLIFNFLDNVYRECSRYILYLNHMGAPEVFRTVGKWEELLRIDRHNLFRILTGSNWRARRTQRNHKRLQVFRMRSGYLAQDAIRQLEQLLDADYIYQLSLADNRVFNITLLDNAFSTNECARNLEQFTSRLIRNWTKVIEATGQAVVKILDGNTTKSGIFNPTITIVEGSGFIIWEDDAGNFVIADSPGFNYPDASNKKIDAYLVATPDTVVSVGDMENMDFTGLLDISDMPLGGSSVIDSNSNVTTLTIGNKGAASELQLASLPGLTALDLDDLVFSAAGELRILSLINITSLTLPVTGWSMSEISMESCTALATSLNFAEVFLDDATIKLKGCPAASLILKSYGSIKELELDGSATSGPLDCSQIYFHVAASFIVNNNSGLTGITFQDPGGIISGLFQISSNTLSSLDVSTLDISGVTTGNFSNNGLDASNINLLLKEFDQQSPATVTGRSINTTGNTAPDTSSGGADGVAAKTSLQAKGWTVTTD